MKSHTCPECGQVCGRHFPGCPNDDEPEATTEPEPDEDPRVDDHLEATT
jgi:hypothetical protein